MQLPFTAEQFFDVFREYNLSVWPVQVVLLTTALAAVVLIFVRRNWASAAISLILFALWAWLGVVYHLIFFTRINPLAYLFGGLSLISALVFLWQGLLRGRLRFCWMGGAQAAAGITLVFFALVVYPAWSFLVGHRYPAMPTFGLPCPTTIFTLGLLAFLVPPYPRSPFMIPLLWCVVGAQAAFSLGITQDLALIFAGLVGLVCVARSHVQRQAH